MSVAAPPQPPPLLRARDSVDDPSEALIKEAKQRARRRRWIYGGAALVAAIAAAVAVFTVPGSPSSPERAAARPVPTQAPQPLGAPLVQGPDPASTLLASWGQIHVGYVFIYGDGRVLFYSDGLANYRKGMHEFAVYERRLSPRGLDRVRAGKLHPERFLVTRDVDREGRVSIQFGTTERKGLWAEPTSRVYEPSKYAICYGNVGDTAQATDVVGQLPAPAQALLNDKQRTYDLSIGAPWTLTAPETPVRECFEVTAAEASTLYQIFDANGAIIGGGPNTHEWLAALQSFTEYPGGAIRGTPIFPHGQPVFWYG